MCNIRKSHLKLLITSVKLKKNSEYCEKLISLYHKAMVEYRDRAKRSEKLIRRYNNSTCKNDSLERKIEQMEELEMKSILQELKSDLEY